MSYSKTLDKLTADLTGFDTFGEMLNAQGGYRPTILPQAEDRRYEVLADAYDGEQEHRGNDERAWRGYREDQQAPALLTVRLSGVPAQSGLVSDWLRVIWQANRISRNTFGEPFAFYYGHGGWTEEYPRFRVVLDVTPDDDTTTPAHATITAFTPGAVNLLQDAIAQTGVVPIGESPMTNNTASVIRAFGQAAFNIGYAPFREALDLEDDQYARDKYADLRTLARAMAPFSDKDLARLTEAWSADDCDESCQATHNLPDFG